MKVYQALILGVLQGITEFLPVSSSGHLILLPNFFGWEIQSLAFDTVLHLGTAAALILYFLQDILEVLKSKKYLKLIIIGSVPAVIAGVLLEGVIETYLRSPSFVALFLFLGTILIGMAELTYKKVWHEERIDSPMDISGSKAFMIGLFQSLALFSGVSRSGATISGGIFAGFNREAAARFSFILSIPIVIGAGVFKVAKSYQELGLNVVLMTGFLASLFTGIFVIKWLLKFLKNNTLTPFVVYRLMLIGIILLLLI